MEIQPLAIELSCSSEIPKSNNIITSLLKFWCSLMSWREDISEDPLWKAQILLDSVNARLFLWLVFLHCPVFSPSHWMDYKKSFQWWLIHIMIRKNTRNTKPKNPFREMLGHFFPCLPLTLHGKHLIISEKLHKKWIQHLFSFCSGLTLSKL